MCSALVSSQPRALANYSKPRSVSGRFEIVCLRRLRVHMARRDCALSPGQVAKDSTVKGPEQGVGLMVQLGSRTDGPLDAHLQASSSLGACVAKVSGQLVIPHGPVTTSAKSSTVLPWTARMQENARTCANPLTGRAMFHVPPKNWDSGPSPGGLPRRQTGTRSWRNP